MRYELVEKEKNQVRVIGRYDTPERAEGERNLLERVWGKMHLKHGELVIREVRAQ